MFPSRPGESDSSKSKMKDDYYNPKFAFSNRHIHHSDSSAMGYVLGKKDVLGRKVILASPNISPNSSSYHYQRFVINSTSTVSSDRQCVYLFIYHHLNVNQI